MTDPKQQQTKAITPTTPGQHGRAMIPAPQTSQALAAREEEAAAFAMAAKHKAMVEARFTIAMHRPRDLDAVRVKLLALCERPLFAKGATYYKPIGDGVEGPSIRFVEAALQIMGNVGTDTEVIHEDDASRTLRIEVTDYESNIGHAATIVVPKEVERSSVSPGDEVIRQRTNSRGKPVYIRRATNDEILNTANALSSKALRTVGLRVLPGFLVAEALDVIYRVQQQIEAGEAKDPEAMRRQMFDAFAEVNVTPEQVKAYLGHDAKKLTEAERRRLIGIRNALRDGETTWREVMEQANAQREEKGEKPQTSDAPAPAAAAQKGAEGLKARVAAGKGPATPQGAPEAPAAPAAARPAQAPRRGPTAPAKGQVALPVDPAPSEAPQAPAGEAQAFCAVCGVGHPPERIDEFGLCPDCRDDGSHQ